MDEIQIDGSLTTREKEELLSSAIKDVLAKGGNEANIHLWIENVLGAEAENDELAEKYGFVSYRDLYQLSCGLPLPQEKLTGAEKLNIRPFRDGDTDEFLEVQNRAFEWHPEEANMDEAELKKRFSQSWYDPDDFLLLHQDEKLIGFCWTKIHPPQNGNPAKGEIYMVGLDPSMHGHGLGKPLTARGFQHLAERGLGHGILFVESDNHAANAIYKELGMKLESVNRAYKRL